MPIGYRRSDVSVTDIRHDLFVYETDAELAAQIERYVVAGLEADEAVTVVVSAGKQRLLREALGQAADFVSFLGTGDVYTRPEAAMATYEASVRKSEEALDAGIRVYGELPICETQAEWNRWMAYESLADRVFAHRPVVLMCGYDRRVVPEAVVHQAWQTHRVVHAQRLAAQPRVRGARGARTQPRAARSSRSPTCARCRSATGAWRTVSRTS